MRLLLFAAAVALTVPNVAYAQPYVVDPNTPWTVAPNMIRPLPIQPAPITPDTVPPGRFSTVPQPIFTCAQAAAQLQSIIGKPEAVAHQVTYKPLLIREPGYRYPAMYIAERLNIWISNQRIITRVQCG